MKPCPSCSRQLADNAVTCPQCGHAFPKRTKEEEEKVRSQQVLGVVVFLVGAALGGVPLLMGFGKWSVMYDWSPFGRGVALVSSLLGLVLLLLGLGLLYSDDDRGPPFIIFWHDS